SQIVGVGSWKNAVPWAVGSIRVATRVCTTRSKATMRAKCSLLVVVTRAPDDDPVGLDGDLDGPVAGPMLGVDRVVLHGGVEPQAVALLAVIEGALQSSGRATPTAGASAASATSPATPAPAPRATAVVLLAGLVVLALVVGFALRLGLGLLGLELGGDQRVVLGAQVDLVVEIGCDSPWF